MSTTAPRSQKREGDQEPAWITFASLFVGHRLDKRAAVGAYIAGAATLAVSLVILIVAQH